eukprot:2473458-Rhodomonas_salina.3
MGVHKEKYYLLLVLGSSDFLWASSTTTRASQEQLLMDFLRLTSAKIKTLSVNCDGNMVWARAPCVLRLIAPLRASPSALLLLTITLLKCVSKELCILPRSTHCA